MNWTVCFVVALVLFVGSVTFAVVRDRGRYKSGWLLSPIKILIVGVAASAAVLFVPVYVSTFQSTGCGAVETLLIALHNVIRLFVVDGEFEFITSNLGSMPLWVSKGYTLLFSVLFITAPALTFGFVLSFFKNISAYRRYVTHYWSDVYIFSELNEKSLALATSLCDADEKGRFFVFTDVFEKDEEKSFELMERAKELGAIFFKKDIVTLDFSFHSKKKQINFFAIGEDQTENINQALKLVDKMKYRENTNLYVFSTQIESEMILGHASSRFDENIKIHVRRINEVRSLVFRDLYENGYEKIFQSAYDDKSGVKKINAVVVGMGQHGTEMTKALSWFCQMTGYLAQIDVFDTDPLIKEKFVSACPELMKLSGRSDIRGEAQYTINIHPDINVEAFDFDTAVASLPRSTFVFVALGDDVKNIAAAVKLRSIYERLGYSPEIQAVVYNSDKKSALTGIENFKGEKYDIDFIGDINTSYSEAVIIASDIEHQALERHKKWGSEEDFWRYDYNYKSSVASAIHRSMKIKCDIPGIKKQTSERTNEELTAIRVLEHCRWNAYMRSEGYVYSGSTDKSSRNDLAKMHNCLVAFDELPASEKEKDDD